MLAVELRGDARLRMRARQALADLDPHAALAAAREALRRGVPPPDAPRALRPSTSVSIDLDVDVWVEHLDGRVERAASAPSRAPIVLPPHVRWWVQPSGPIEPETLARACVEAEVDGVALGGPDVSTQLAAVAEACPRTLRSVTITSPPGVLDRGTVSLIATLPGLEWLTLRDSALGTEEIASLAAARLRWLSIDGAALHDQSLSALAPLTDLRGLELTRAPGLVGPGLAAIAALPRLELLSLRGATSLRGEGVAELARARGLRVLDLSDCPLVDALGLRALASGPVSAGLTELNLGWCDRIGQDTLSLLEHLPALERLSVGGWHLGDPAVLALARVPRLRRLSINAPLATSAGVDRLPGDFEELRLHLPAVSAPALAALIRRSPGLEHVTTRAPRVDAGVLAALGGGERLMTCELEQRTHDAPSLAPLRGLPRLARLRLGSAAFPRDIRC